MTDREKLAGGEILGRLAGLASRPFVGAAKSQGVQKSVTGGLTRYVNQPLERGLRAGGVHRALGEAINLGMTPIPGTPKMVLPVLKNPVERAVYSQTKADRAVKTLSENPEIIGGAAIPLPGTTETILGAKHLIRKALGVKTAHLHDLLEGFSDELEKTAEEEKKVRELENMVIGHEVRGDLVYMLAKGELEGGELWTHALFHKKNKKPVAQLSLLFHPELPVGEVRALHTHQEFRGKGHTKTLFSYAERAHPRDHFVVLPDPWKDESVGIQDLRKIYEGLGFRPHGEFLMKTPPKERNPLTLKPGNPWKENIKVAEVLPYQQKTQWSCSASCLKAVAAHHGVRVPELGAIELVGAQPGRGAETDQIANAARKLGFLAFEYSFASIEQAKFLLDQGLPIICDIQSFNHPGKGHYVVLVAADDKRVELMDPNTPGNWRVISHAEMNARWWDRAMAPPHDMMWKWGIVIVPPGDS